MSFKDHATYGPVGMVCLDDFIYLNQIHTLHTMGLNLEEAKNLKESLEIGIKYLESKGKSPHLSHVSRET
jgi:hypothetical protein